MSIQNDGRRFKREWRNVQLAALLPYLSDDDIEAACRALGHRWRASVFPPGGGGAFAALSRSFARTIQEQREIRNELLAHIAGLVIPNRPGRHEPRLVKCVPQNFGTLRISRTEAKRCA